MKTLALASGLMFTASFAQAANVTVNLGQSAENFILTGLGPLGNGNGTYNITQGNCVNAAGETTCTLSGAITGSSNANYSSGTYSFVTTFATGDVQPLQGESQTPTSDLFFYDYIASDVSITLDLNTPSGNYTEDLFSGGNFVPNTGFGFTYVSYVCTGVTVCSQANVGQVVGATTTGPVTISANFDVPVVSSAPEPASIAMTGIGSVLAGAVFLRRRKNA